MDRRYAQRLSNLLPRLTVALGMALLLSCEPSSDPGPVEIVGNGATSSSVDMPPDPNPQASLLIGELVQIYLAQIDTDFAAAADNLDLLQQQIIGFLDTPNLDTLGVARSSWLDAYSSYELTSLHQHFAMSLLAPDERARLSEHQYFLNQWPILPGYIDYVAGYPQSGIVNDLTVALDVDSLRQQHGMFELSEAALGFHVIEFLLWGNNIDQEEPRSHADYLGIVALSERQASNGLSVEQLDNNRRREYLRWATEALVDEFVAMQSLWSQSSGRASLGSGLSAPARGTDYLQLLFDSATSMLTQELLVRSLYPLLNGDYTTSIPSPFSHSSPSAVSAHLSSVERLLIELSTPTGVSLDSLLLDDSEEFGELFYANFDSSKECLIVLYSDLRPPSNATETLAAEFEIVECINLLSNTIDHLEQLKYRLLDRTSI